MSEAVPAPPDPVVNTCPNCGQLLDVTDHDPYSKIECPSCGEFIRIRTEFNHFKIVQPIGEGGMSRVFLAEDMALGRMDALKILNREFSQDAARTGQFEREATITASISHPNVVKVYSVGHDQGFFYIAMEHVSAGSLDEMIRARGRIDEGTVLRVGFEIARGLRAAGNAGLIHRDVKPGNILFGGDGTAKIVDFGLALVHGRDSDESGEIWATPYYVPPEKLDHQRDDFRGDIYSLGASLFHALAGFPPFAADTTSVVELKKLKAKRVSLADSAPDISEETCELVDRAMAHDPADRHASYDELIDHLQYARKALRRGGGGAAYGRRRARKKGLMLGGVAAAIVLAMAAVIFIPSGPQADVPEEGAGAATASDSGAIELSADGGATVSARFVAGREALAAGRADEALAAFEGILATPGVLQPTLDWTRYHAGLCHLLRGALAEALPYFTALEGDAGADGPATVSEAEAILFDDMARLMAGTIPVDPGFVTRFPPTTVRAAGLLVFGLKNWCLGNAVAAGPYFEAFGKAAPPAEFAWLVAYVPLAEPYRHDLGLLRGLPEITRNMTYPEAKEAFATIAEAVGQLRLDTGLAAAARAQLVAGERRLAQWKEAYEKRESERMREVEAAEMEAVAALRNELAALRAAGAFADGVAVLERAEFESEAARAAISDLLYLWGGAAKFLPQLVADIGARGYEGALYRGSAPPVSGVVESATEEVLTVVTGGRESELPVAEIPAGGLVKMGETVLATIDDADLYYQRRESLVAFASLSGLGVYADVAAGELAGELAPFRDRWERMRASGIVP